MNWSSLKNLMLSGHERFIIVENDTPEFVVLSLEEYQRLVQGMGNQSVASGVNEQLQGIAQDSSEQDAYSSPPISGPSAPDRFNRDARGSIRLEDLPL